MALKAIYLDLDGVIVDMWAGVSELLGVSREMFYQPEHSSYDAFLPILEAHLGRPYTQVDFLEALASGGWELWANLPKYPWSDELIELCRSSAPTVIMTRPAPNPESAHGKMAWIQKNFPDIERFAITPCKHHMAHPGGLLIDDSPEGTKLFREHEGWTYTFPQPWNCSDWQARDRLKEIRELIEDLKGECSRARVLPRKKESLGQRFEKFKLERAKLGEEPSPQSLSNAVAAAEALVEAGIKVDRITALQEGGIVLYILRPSKGPVGPLHVGVVADDEDEDSLSVFMTDKGQPDLDEYFDVTLDDIGTACHRIKQFLALRERRFPILGEAHSPDVPQSIPWDVLNEHQAQTNHGGQTLERLAQRGGLSPSEAYAVAHRKHWERIDREVALAWLRSVAG